MSYFNIQEFSKRNPTLAEFISKLGSFSIGPIVAAFIGFISVPITTRLVDPYLYGQLSMFTTALSLVGMVVVLGMDQAYVREYAGAKDASKLWLNAFLLPLSLSILLSLLVLMFRDSVSMLLFEEVMFVPVVLFALALPSVVVKHYASLAVRMNEAGRFYSALNIITKLVTVILTILFVLSFGPGLVQLMLPVIIASLVVIILILKSAYAPKIQSWRVDAKIISKQLTYGLPLVLASAQMWILNSLDKFALRAWSDFNEMGLYTAAFKLVAPVLIIKTAFGMFWAPLRYRWREEGVSHHRFQKVTDAMTLLIVMVFAFMVPMRWVFIRLLGPQYHAAVTLVPLTLVFPLMYTLSETTVMGIGFSRKTYWETIGTGIAAVINVVGNWLLVPEYGAFGAALATAIAFLSFFWIRTIISNRLWKGVRVGVHVYATLAIIGMNITAVFFSDWRVDLIIAGIVMAVTGLAMSLRWKKHVK